MWKSKAKCFMLPAVAVLLTIALGAAFVSTESDWYASLLKPAFMPAAFAFPIIWGIVYFCIYCSSVIVCKTKNNHTLKLIYLLNLALNAFWPYVFFELQNPQGAFVVIVLMNITLYLMVIATKKVDYRATYFLLPYVVWLIIATAINYYIAIFN